MMSGSRTLVPLPPRMTVICPVQETRPNSAVDLRDSTCTTSPELSQRLPRFLSVVVVAAAAEQPPVHHHHLPFSMVFRRLGIIQDVSCMQPFLLILILDFSYVRSFSDDAFGRVFTTENPDNANLTVESCIELCDSSNFTVAGMEFAVQCC